MIPSIVSGVVVGTGAALTVNCGFVPDCVELINTSSATKEEVKWVKGMAAASGLKTVDAARSIVAVGGVTVVGGTEGDTVEQGFTIGTDADLNVIGENIYYRATRAGPGAQ